MSKPQALNQTREQITALDKDLLALLAKRRNLSLDVARSKEIDIRPIRDTQREKELLARLVKQGREQGLDAHYVISLYQSIIEDSVLNQQAYLQGRANPDSQKQQYCVAYLGARGSYSYLAASRYCDRRQVDMQDLGCKSFDEIVQAVESGHADYGFLPIENTSSGSINEVYDVLQHTSLAIVGETTIEVGHCLLAKTGSNPKDIKTVFAHPQPISQCSRYLALHSEYKLEYCSSSAEAMDRVMECSDNSVAAIGSAEGGALYQLEAIEQDLANQKINQSRFIVVARKAIAVPEQLPAKSTLIMATGQKPGALVEALLVLKAHNLNMSKLESRPIPGTPWEEMFYLDLDANLSSPDMQSALKELERITRFIKVLGCYPCETVSPTQLTNSQLIIEPDTSRAQNSNDEAVKHTDIQQQVLRSSKVHKPQASQMSCGQLQIGDGQFGALALLSLPQESQLFSQKAKTIKEAGFQAIVIEGLSRQQNVEQSIIEFKKSVFQFGLECIIAVEHEAELQLAAEHGTILLITGKQMHNIALLKKVGSLHMPVILERNTMASVEEYLAAAEVILSQGNQQLTLCESGIRTFNDSLKPSLDLAGLVELKSLSHLPILVNPSYSSTPNTLLAHSKAAKQLNADGLVLNFSSNTEIFNSELKSHSELLRNIYS
ncbi:chorismate mutase [Shewanella eurypsychrophilus]|uniref:Chorismate mutase n=1 Tax=Shewanella eurypsychrophilus TaxID=2593656 RepID=A0ABX6V334_9GAMM|nr:MULTISPECIES: chorismate mutase [Shewanella]QFU21752.1 chorismate mutase [Shewanella sp. YLB-09]QPG57042.1 chorismate mutase [Shewanella eurypsychrophilus]